MVEEGGFEPPKLKSDRFTVCSLWPLGNSSIYEVMKDITCLELVNGLSSCYRKIHCIFLPNFLAYALKFGATCSRR